MEDAELVRHQHLPVKPDWRGTALYLKKELLQWPLALS